LYASFDLFRQAFGIKKDGVSVVRFFGTISGVI
jgi:hypothetical protein